LIKGIRFFQALVTIFMPNSEISKVLFFANPKIEEEK